MHSDSIAKVIAGVLKTTMHVYPNGVTFKDNAAYSLFINHLAAQIEANLTDGLRKRIAQSAEERLLQATDIYKLVEDYREKNEKLMKSNRYLLDKLNEKST